jgi:hypothetical protein
MNTYINNQVAITNKKEIQAFEAAFAEQVSSALNETVTIVTGDPELGIRRVQTADGIFITTVNDSLFVEDYAHGADFDEIEHSRPFSVLKANIEWLRNARKAN